MNVADRVYADRYILAQGRRTFVHKEELTKKKEKIMKKIQRVVAASMTFMMTLSMFTVASANEIDAKLEAEVAQVVASNEAPEIDESIQDTELSVFVKEFLSDNSYNVYMGEERELEEKLLDEAEVPEVEATLNAAKRSRSAAVPAEFSIDENLDQHLENKAVFKSFVAEEEEIVREDFEVFHIVESVEENGDYAVLNVYETVRFQYEDYDQPSAIGTEYQVSVVRTEDGWAVTDTKTDDLTDEIFEDDSFDLEAELEIYEENHDAVEASLPEEALEEAEDAHSLIAPRAATSPSVIYYDRIKAANYARNYTTTESAPIGRYYNDNFTNFNSVGGDCMNFASQAMWAGFSGSDDLEMIRNKELPADTTGSYTWWSAGKSGAYVGSWTSNSAFYNYMVGTNKETNGHSIDNNIYKVASTASFSGIHNYQTRMLGAVVSGRGGNENFAHAGVIVDVKGPTRSQIYLCTHNSDNKNVKMSDIFPLGDVRIFVPEVFNIRGANANRIRVLNTTSDCKPLGTTMELKASATQTAYRMSMQVITPSGKIIWLSEKTNLKNYSEKYQFNERGLYKISAFARDVSESTPGSYSAKNSYCLRIY